MTEYIRVATTGEVPPGTMKRVDVAGTRVVLVNVGGEFVAVDDTCSHEEASLSQGTLTGEVVVCPKHGARFNVKTGRVLSLPAVRSLAVYPVRVDGDAVLVSPDAQRSGGVPHRRSAGIDRG
jgi:3-phenylpropionate/trans-cinnamate dioxygenase ferredoxin component